MNDRMLVIVSAWLVNEQPNACNRLVTWEMSTMYLQMPVVYMFVDPHRVYYSKEYL